jgi:4-amino-4-deoxy-L-arabinose transferase-like glycosyltransferase
VSASSDPRLPFATGAVASLCLAQLAIYALTSGPLAYGRMNDEFYYLACASRLAWGYVDHPPLSIALLALVRPVLGDSDLALNLLPALAACANLVLLALLARELGGGRKAQALAAVAAFAAPVYQAVAGFYSMNAFEPAIWTAAAWLLARIGNGARTGTWMALGVVLGLGLLNKISVLWLGFGLVLGLVLTPARHRLATPGPWLAGAIALALFAPHLVWQQLHGWPTLEFIHNASQQKMVHKAPLAFAAEQLLVLGPLCAVVWLAGLGWYFTRAGRSQRWLAFLWIGTIALLIASGTARSNYSAPSYCVLLAAGGVAIERLSRARLRALAVALVVLLLVEGALTLPLAVPVLPPERVPGYAAALGVEAPRDQVDDTAALPLHFAQRFGWRELAEAVARAADTLSPADRAVAVVLAPSYGEAGAIEHYAAELALPPAVSGHNSYWLWGLGDRSGDVAIAIATSDAQLARWYTSVERVGGVECRWCVPRLARASIYVARGLRVPRDEFWAGQRSFR